MIVRLSVESGYGMPQRIYLNERRLTALKELTSPTQYKFNDIVLKLTGIW